MEGFKKNPIEKAARIAAVAGALMGAQATVEMTTDSKPAHAQQERQENFSPDREVKAFLDVVAKIDGIDDARGRQKMRVTISEHLNKLALALESRTPYYSAKEGASLSGTVTPKMQETLKMHLLPKLLADRRDEPGLNTLKQMLLR